VSRQSEAEAYYQAGLERVKTSPIPLGQRFIPGTRVSIASDLGESMNHFPKGCSASVLFTYAHAYGGSNVTSYCLDVDGRGATAWYQEHQLELLT